MPTQADARAHQKALDDLTTLAQAELVAAWRTLDLSNPSEAAGTVRELLPVIVSAYALASATLAADFYDDMRSAAGVAGSFAVDLADLVAPERVQSLAGWGTAPLFDRDFNESQMLAEDFGVKVDPRPAPDPDRALSRLSGGLQRAVADADRDTIALNAERDPADARWARHASANACAFCALLATRDATYNTETSAVRVTEARSGKRKLGEKYHDHCRCIAVPEWPDAPLERAPYVSDWENAYAAATAELGGANDPKAILSHMRQTLGSH